MPSDNVRYGTLAGGLANGKDIQVVIGSWSYLSGFMHIRIHCDGLLDPLSEQDGADVACGAELYMAHAFASANEEVNGIGENSPIAELQIHVRLARKDHADKTVLAVAGHAPLEGFFDGGNRLEDNFAESAGDCALRLGEIGDVLCDAGVFHDRHAL